MTMLVFQISFCIPVLSIYHQILKKIIRLKTKIFHQFPSFFQYFLICFFLIFCCQLLCSSLKLIEFEVNAKLFLYRTNINISPKDMELFMSSMFSPIMLILSRYCQRIAKIFTCSSET